MRPGSTNNGMGACVCECVFSGFCYEGLPCRGSDGWGWVSEAFSINLPLSLQGAPIRLCSFTCSLSLSHTHTNTHTHTLSHWHTSPDCNCMLLISCTLFIAYTRSQGKKNQPNTWISCLTQALIVITHRHACTHTVHQQRGIVSCTIIPYLFVHAPHRHSSPTHHCHLCIRLVEWNAFHPFLQCFHPWPSCPLLPH